MAGAPRRACGLPPARACACRRCPATTPASAPGPKGLTKAERAFLASITLYEDDDLLVLNKPHGHRGAGWHQDHASSRPAARRLGRGPEIAVPPRSPARPRYLRRARGRQAPRGRGEARPRLPDPLGAQDLLGAGAGRAEAAARQGRRGAGQGVRAGGRPRAQGEGRRAGRGPVGGDLLRRGGSGRAEGFLALAQAGHRASASAPRPHGHHRPPHPR